LEESWVTGQVKVTLNDYVFNGSYGMKHYAELTLQIIQKASRRKSVGSDTPPTHRYAHQPKKALLKYVPDIVLIRHDGGHDHKNRLLQNIAASMAIIEFLQLHVCVNKRNAPDGSWVNIIERCMNLLNLAIAHQSYARDECAT
jgi:hypothetical protein